MSQLSTPTASTLLGHPFQIAVQIQTYSPTTFDLSQPLIVTDVINPFTINLPPINDLVDEDALEALRNAWETALLTPHAIGITHDNPDSDTLVYRAFNKVADKIDGATLVAFVQEARFPIPPDYTIKLPQTEKLARQEIIESLVPFRQTAAMLKRMEESFNIPIATVRLSSQRMDVPTSQMH